MGMFEEGMRMIG